MKKISALIITVLSLFTLIGCNSAHIHNLEDKFQYDNDFHWQECKLCDKFINKQQHIFSDWQEDLQSNGLKTRACLCGYIETTKQVENELFYYEVLNEGVAILKYLGSDNDVQIPTEIGGKQVVKICSGAFIKKQSLPYQRRILNNVEDENNQSENLCVYIPESVEYIENETFEDNTIFITDAQSKKSTWEDDAIGESATAESTKKGNVHYGYKNGDTYTEGGIKYVYSSSQQGYFLASCLRQNKNIQIPAYINGKPVVHIGQGAFLNNTKIKKVEIPETVGYIWYDAFKNCTALEEINFKRGNLSKIRSGSFSGCTSLKKINLPTFVTLIEGYAFAYCGEIEKMIVPAALITVYSHAFFNTVIKEIDYLGSEANLANLAIDASGNDGFINAQINILGKNEVITINDFNQLDSIDYGTIIEIEGYVAFKSNGKYIFLINEDNTYGVQVYIAKYTGEIPNDKAKVKVTGAWARYTGQDQITSIENIEVIEENALSADPIPVTIDDIESSPELYQCRYLLFTGKVHSVDGNNTYFVRSDGTMSEIFLYYDKIPVDTQEEVEFLCTLIQFNTLYELCLDSVAFSEKVVVSDLREFDSIKDGAWVEIEGYVSSFSLNNSYMYIVNEDNSAGVQIYLGKYYGELPSENSKVKLLGVTNRYKSQSQIYQVKSIEVIEENAITINPIVVTIEELEKHPEEYLCRKIIVPCKVDNSKETVTLLVKEDGTISYIQIFPDTRVYVDISILGTLVRYEDTYCIMVS